MVFSQHPVPIPVALTFVGGNYRAKKQKLADLGQEDRENTRLCRSERQSAPGKAASFLFPSFVTPPRAESINDTP
jgi:hypothetical protein